MENTQFAFCVKTYSFYAYTLKKHYEAHGVWPEDHAIVSNSVREQFLDIPQGKEITADESGRPVFIDKALPPLAEQIESLYTLKLNEIHTYADALVIDLENKYSEIEKSTFTKQRSEAEAWQADNQAQTPNLDQLATTRGIDRLVFIQKVIDAINEADQKSFAVVAIQQAKEDELNAAKALGLDALNAVDTTLVLGA